MSSELESAAQRRERLSALVDGELDAPASSSACECWHGDDELRRDWHAWHLIGDVLRSDDLAGTAQRDLSLLAVVRERLAAEPVVLAPRPLLQPPAQVRPASRGQWRVPAAVAAGFALVVGTVVVMQPADVNPGAPVQVAAQAEGSVAPDRLVQTPAAGRQMIRDARLDRYLAAHKQFAGSSALGVPSAFLSGATVEASSR